MTSKERVRTTFEHREPDRVPIYDTVDSPIASKVLGREAFMGFNGYFRGKVTNDLLNQGKRDYLVERMCEDIIELTKKVGFDIMPTGPTVPKGATGPEEIEPNVWKFINHSTGVWSVMKYSPEDDMYSEIDSSIKQKGLSEFEKYVEGVENTKPEWDESVFENMKMVINEYGDEYFILSGPADVHIPTSNIWFSDFLMWMLLEPELVQRFFDAHTAYDLVLIDKLAEFGVDAIGGGADWAYRSGPLFSPELFYKFIYPNLKKVTDRCHKHGIYYIKHTDGDVNKLLDMMVEAGVDAFMAIESGPMDIAKVKREYGDKLTLVGNIDCAHTLVSGTPEDVEKEVKGAIKVAAPGGGYVLQSSNSIHIGVKYENFWAMINAAKKYGKYPIDV